MIVTEHTRKLVESASPIRKMFELGNRFRAEGKDPIDLSLGNPDVKPSLRYFAALTASVLEAMFSRRNLCGYMPNPGFPKTRARVASDLAKQFRVDFKPEDIFMTAGAAHAIDIALETIIEPVIDRHTTPSTIAKRRLRLSQAKLPIVSLDQVIVFAPFFVEYGHYIQNNQGEVIPVLTKPQTYEPDLEALARAIREETVALLINPQNNPTGIVYSKGTLTNIALILKGANRLRKRPIVCIEDAPYSEIVFSGDAHSMLEVYPYTMHVNSFSKSWGISGERLGYLALHPDITNDKEEKETLTAALTANLRTRCINAPALQQRVLAKLGISSRANLNVYKKRIKHLSDVLKETGFKFNEPEGTFYLFSEVPDKFKDEEEFRVHAHSGNDPLLYTPASAFGGNYWPRSLRFAACCSDETIERAAGKLRRIC